MDDDPRHQTWLTRFAASAFLHIEFTIYAVLGALLALTAILAVIHTAGTLWQAVAEFSGPSGLLQTVDRLLLVLMLVEILHTVRVSMRSGTLEGEPFLIVGLIASIRRILVITLQSSEAMSGKDWSAGQETAFRASMIELGVLGFLVLAMGLSIYLLRRAQATAAKPDEG